MSSKKIGVNPSATRTNLGAHKDVVSGRSLCPRCNRTVPIAGEGSRPVQHRDSRGGVCDFPSSQRHDETPRTANTSVTGVPGAVTQTFALCPVCAVKMSISPRKNVIPKHKNRSSTDYCAGVGLSVSRSRSIDVVIRSKRNGRHASRRPSVLPVRTLPVDQMYMALKRSIASTPKRRNFTGQGLDGWPLSTSVSAVPTVPPGMGKRR